MSLPPWAVDPAAPAVPDFDEEDVDEVVAARAEAERAPPAVDPWGVHAAARARDEAHLYRTRWHLTLRRARRLAAPWVAAPEVPTPAPAADWLTGPGPLLLLPEPRRKGGHPGHRARNDRLLALYEEISARAAHLPHLHRCRMAGEALLREGGTDRPMPATTARDAIAEALGHRVELARAELSAGDLFDAP